MQSIGKQLAEARQARGWSIEDVAFQTHIPARRLRDIENDDLSRFANLTYARGFLKLYSRHLDLDISDYLDRFDTRALSQVTGREYARAAGSLHSISSFSIEPRRNNGATAAWIVSGALVLVVVAVLLRMRPGRDDARDPAPPAAETQNPPAESEAPPAPDPAQDPIPDPASDPAPDDSEPEPAPAPRATPVPEEDEAGLEGIPRALPLPVNPDARAAG